MELEQRLMEAKLRQQQLQSEADSRWLHQEESNLVSPDSDIRFWVFYPLFNSQKKRLSITHSFGSEHSDSSEGILASMDSPPRTPGLASGLQASDKDRSSTPMSSGSEERQFVVKVRDHIHHSYYLMPKKFTVSLIFSNIRLLCSEDGAHPNGPPGPRQ